MRDTRSRDQLSQVPALAPLAKQPAFATLDISDLRMTARLVEHAGTLAQITEASARAAAEGSDRRLDRMQRALRRLVGHDHPAATAVSAALSRVRNDKRDASGRDTRSRELILQSPHWSQFRGDARVAVMSMAQLRAADRLLARVGAAEATTEQDIVEIAGSTPGILMDLRAALGKLFGPHHPATAAAILAIARGRARDASKRDRRPRELVLAAPHWAKLRASPAAAALPMKQLRIVDRFFAYCAARRLAHIAVEHVKEFDENNADQGRLQRLRNGLKALYGLNHPIVHMVEEARIAKSRAYYETNAPGPTVGQGVRPLKFSVLESELPALWRDTLGELDAGRRVQGRKASVASVESMRMEARRLVWAARQESLPNEISLGTLRAHDRALDVRRIRASTRAISFGWIRMLGSFVGAQEAVLADARGVAAFYERLAALDLPLKEDRLADLPDLGAVFEKAHGLLEAAASETHSTKRATLHTDAGALVLLSLIPFRNQDTVLRWGKNITFENDRYHLSKTITKTGAAFSGKLHRVVDPFLDALILQGRHPAFLPQLRKAALEAQAPVFPKSNGGARSVAGLSRRWQQRIGTGSTINRTRIHTMLGELGPSGVRAALALCAQRAYRTAQHYQADALARNEMCESQVQLSAMVPLSDHDLEQRLAGL